MSRSRSLSLSREVLIGSGSKVAMALLGFAGVVVFANELGDVGVGRYRTVVAAVLVLSQVPAGVGVAVRKRVSEIGAKPAEFFGASLLIQSGYTVVVLLGMLLIYPLAVSFFGGTDLALVLVPLLGAITLFKITNELYAGLGYPGLSSWVDAVRSLLTTGFQVGFVLLGWGPLGVVLGLALASALTACLAWGLAGVLPRIPSRDTVEHLYEFARWSVPNLLLDKGQSHVDVLVLSALVGPAGVGLYTVATTLVAPGSMFSGTVRNALTVKASGVSSAGGSVREDLVNSVAYSGLISIPIVFGAAAIPNRLLVTVFGSDFVGGGDVLVWLAVALVFGAYAGALDGAIEGVDRPDTVLVGNGLVFLVRVVSIVSLGVVFGTVGVGGGYALSNGFRVTYFQWAARRQFGSFVFPRPVAYQLFSAAVMFLFVETVSRFVAVTGWQRLAAIVIAGASVYFVALLVTSAHFRGAVRNALSGAASDAD